MICYQCGSQFYVTRRVRTEQWSAEEELSYVQFCPFCGNWRHRDEETALKPGAKKPRGFPRTQYERTYVLIHQSRDIAWPQAAVNALWDKGGYTIGNSADDAGVGALDVKRVIVVNPGDWADDLAGWFAWHYPGVEYASVEAESPEELRAVLGELAS